MATIVSQGASATVSLPAGSNIAVTGTGFAVMGPGRLQGTQYGLQGSTRVGPFDTAQTVYLTSTTTALSYTIAPGYVGAGPVQTARNADGTPSGLIDPATGQAVGGGVGYLGVPLKYPLTNWKKRFARCASGGILTRITVFGDSNIGDTGAGAYYDETGTMQNTASFGLLGSYKYGIAQVMLNRLVARYGVTVGESFFGDQGQNVGGTPVAYTSMDSRMVYGAGWGSANNRDTVGGSWFQATGASGGALQFTPTRAWSVANAFTIRYSGGCADARISANGVLKSTLNMSGGSALVKTQITADALAIQPLSFQGYAAGDYLVVGGECYDASNPGLIVRQVGQSGLTSGAIVGSGSPWQTGAWHAANPGNLSIIYSTINDVINLTVAQYKANMVTWANRCIANGEDMLWVGCFPASDAQTTNGTLDAFKAAAAEVFDPLGVNMIDLRDYLGSTWAIANAAGYMYDSRHPNRTGHAFIGQLLADIVGA